MGKILDLLTGLLTPEELLALKAELREEEPESPELANARKENNALRISLRKMGEHILRVLAFYGIKQGEANGEEKKAEEKPVTPENSAPKEGRHRITEVPGTESGVGAIPYMPPRKEITARKSGIYAALQAAGKRGMTVKQIVLYLEKIGFPVNSDYYATSVSGRGESTTRIHVAVRNDLYRWKLSGKVTVVEREIWKLTGKADSIAREMES